VLGLVGTFLGLVVLAVLVLGVPAFNDLPADGLMVVAESLLVGA
jgi:hypothetical protein